MNVEKYFDDLKKSVDKEYLVANEARKVGLDPEDFVEVPLALTMAERSVNLVKTIYPNLPVEKISRRILELEDEYGKLDTTVSFIIAREIAENKFVKFDDKLFGIDCGIRVGFSYLTLGVVASPLEGYTGLRLGKTKNGEDYFIVKFSGPIRSAGTTASCLVLMLIDYLREYFGFAKYDPSDDEVKRYVQENTDYHERVTNLQYFGTVEEMEFLARNIPIQIDGDPTEKKEVSNYKDLDRVDTNFIRGGMCLIFSEGLAQKATKALGRLVGVKANGLICSGWDFLENYSLLHSKRQGGMEDLEATYIKDLVAGRPVYGHPGYSGGFRFRYGRSRTSGFSAVGIHPATMGVTNGFLSNGTQLKIEKPTKGCIVTSVDSIDGPIVRLKNGSVKKLDSFEEAKKLYNEVDEIIYLGDILFPFGDIVDRNSDLVKPGYVEEWWELELLESVNRVEGLDDSSMQNNDVFDAVISHGDNNKKMGKDGFDSENISFDLAVELSRKYGVALHPKFIFYWTEVSNDDFCGLVEWLNLAVWRSGKLVFPWEVSNREKFGVGKRALELLGVRHIVHMDNVIVDEDALALLFNLGIENLYNGQNIELKRDETDDRCVLEIVNDKCRFEVKDKAGTFIGARMGRPEKAKLRSLVGSPNSLFPVSDQGGRLRSIQDAVGEGFVKTDFVLRRCEVCGNDTIYGSCENCGGKTVQKYFCRDCREVKDSVCKLHNNGLVFQNRKIDVSHFLDSAISKLKYGSDEVPSQVKGIRKLVNDFRIPENLAKGVLRAKYNLSVNKDGTVRYDGTEIPITHFKPVEIRVSVEKLREFGYDKDIFGKDLVSDSQILELMPHDVVLPSSLESRDEKAGDVFLNISRFIDEELERFYGLSKFYNLNGRDDLVGQLVVCMAPHNCAGVIGRIIGWSQMQGVLASPYMHAAMRRDCDGDEAAVMLLLDVLLNFSRKFLPSHNGASQDAPLVLNSRIRAGEVDDQILSFETVSGYPLELYRAAEKGLHSSEVSVGLVRDRLKLGVEDSFVNSGFTHDTVNINFGCNNGSYKVLPTMKEKVAAQMELVEKIRAVDTDDVARLILERHFIRDIKGNLRKFSRQQFRCSSCNEKFRRIPLRGVCTRCGGKIIFTISEGSIKKYLEPARELAAKYNISNYTREGMELIGDYIESIFGKEDKQITL